MREPDGVVAGPGAMAGPAVGIVERFCKRVKEALTVRQKSGLGLTLCSESVNPKYEALRIALFRSGSFSSFLKPQDSAGDAPTYLRGANVQSTLH